MDSSNEGHHSCPLTMVIMLAMMLMMMMMMIVMIMMSMMIALIATIVAACGDDDTCDGTAAVAAAHEDVDDDGAKITVCWQWRALNWRPTGISAISEWQRLVLVEHLILDVSHLVMNRDEVVHRQVSAHLYPANTTCLVSINNIIVLQRIRR